MRPERNKKQSRTTFVVYTEDSKSSRYYLEALSKKYRNNIYIKPINLKSGGHPLKLKSEAVKQLKKDTEGIDKTKLNVYLCFDLDKEEFLRNYSSNIEKIKKENTEKIGGKEFLTCMCEPNFEYFHLKHFMRNFSINNIKLYLENHYNRDLDKIKKDPKIYTNLVEDENKIIEAIKNCSVNNQTNKTDFHLFVAKVINYNGI